MNTPFFDSLRARARLISSRSTWICMSAIDIHCLRCGAREMLNRDSDLEKIHTQANAFADVHERCAPASGEPHDDTVAVQDIIDLAAAFLRIASNARSDGQDRQLQIALKAAREQIERAEAILSGVT